MSRKEKCEFIENQRKSIEYEWTKILEKEEGLSDEVKKLIRESMMFEEGVWK